jgi:hypothetical protein
MEQDEGLESGLRQPGDTERPLPSRRGDVVHVRTIPVNLDVVGVDRLSSYVARKAHKSVLSGIQGRKPLVAKEVRASPSLNLNPAS